MMTFTDNRPLQPKAIANTVAGEAASLADGVWTESGMMQILK